MNKSNPKRSSARGIQRVASAGKEGAMSQLQLLFYGVAVGFTLGIFVFIAAALWVSAGVDDASERAGNDRRS